MDTRPDHASSMRVMAAAVARDLGRIVSGERLDEPMGLTTFFRTHSHWRSHGWYGDSSMDRLKDICGRIFASEPDDHEAFVRGLRSSAGILPDGRAAGTISDRDVFWSCVAALGRETGVDMPARPTEGNGPRMRGH